MNAFHTIWTKPKEGKDFEDFEILTLVLSALKWREFNGGIKLYTDDEGHQLLDERNLLDMYDRGIDTETLNDIPETIDSNAYWSAGKIYALKKEPLGSVSIDTDLIAWKDISESISNQGVFATHYDSPYFSNVVGSYYELFRELIINESFVKEFEIDYNHPLNVSLLSITDQQLLDDYFDTFIKFTQNKNINDFINEYKSTKLTSIIFIEQAMLSVLAKRRLTKTAKTISEEEEMFKNIYKQIQSGEKNTNKIEYDNNLYIKTYFNEIFKVGPLSERKNLTHVWGYKKVMLLDDSQRQWFCTNCLIRIKKDFPEYFVRLMEFDDMRRYLKLIKEDQL